MQVVLAWDYEVVGLRKECEEVSGTLDEASEPLHPEIFMLEGR